MVIYNQYWCGRQTCKTKTSCLTFLWSSVVWGGLTTWNVHLYGFFQYGWEEGFHISWFEWTVGECGQPKKLIPEGQGILAFANLSIKSKMAAGSDFYCCGPLIFARQKLVCYCGMFCHVLFEVRGITAWMNASCTLVWFCSSVNAEVCFKMSCFGKWPTTL